jgi:hypothetical protein
MSSLNNKYGVSNGCPPIMNDGRGVNTEFRINRLLTNEIFKSTGAKSTHEYRYNLQQLPAPRIEDSIRGFVCSSIPHGTIVLDKEIKFSRSVLNNGTIIPNNHGTVEYNVVKGQYHKYN